LVLTNPSVVILCLTLQFIRPIQRLKFLTQISQSLKPQGALLLVEKLLVKDEGLNQHFIHAHYALKRQQGYSELEISAKREALENVLIPYRWDENMALLQEAGFSQIEPFFCWYNFAGWIARV
jgi:tRNA (cmo5U34)-methyltransferase